MPQPPVTEREWENRKKAAKARSEALAAETEALEAEAKNIRARDALTAVQATPDPAKAAEAQRLAQARGAKDLAQAASDEAQAKIATWKAAVGAIPASPIDGKVELSDKAGHMESALLAARAMATGAIKVAAAVGGLPSRPAAILVVPHGEAPDLKALNSLRSFVTLLTPALINAQRSLEAALTAKEFPGLDAVAGGAGIAGFGLALEAASKLLAYFRTDYTIGGSESNADHLALAELVAGRLRAALPGTRVYLQSVYAGQEPTLAADFINNELKKLSDLHQTALDKLERAAALIEAPDAEPPAAVPGADALAPVAAMPGPGLSTPPAAAPEPTPAPDVNPTGDARVTAAASRLRQLVTLYETTTAKLMEDGTMATLLRQYALDARLGNGKTHVLVTRLHKAGGSHYVTKNLWNLFGAMPFKVMGGVIVSYSLFEGISGDLVQSDTYSVHGGFATANTIS